MSDTASAPSSTKTPSFTVSTRIQQTLDPCVVLMKELIGKYADQWKDKDGGIYSLAQGVVYWKPPESATAAMKEALANDDNNTLHMYGPDEGLLELRQALQDKVAQENGLTNHHVMVTVGANQAYVNCVLTLLDEDLHKHKAIVFAPYYFNHVMALQMSLPPSAMIVGPSSDQGIPDLEWLTRTLQQDGDSIQMVTLVNPGNPTGVTLSREYLQKVVDLCRQHSCWLVLDSTYEYFVHTNNNQEEKQQQSSSSSSYGFDGCFADPHVIHIFSFSKSYALAGYRCGYVVISKDAAAGGVYDNMMKVQDTIPIAPSRISQIAALGSLRAGPTWVHEKFKTLDTGRQAILETMQQSLPNQPIIGGTGAMYYMVKLPVDDDRAVAELLVRDYGVAVIPGSFCGFPGWLRICYSNLPPADCLKAAKRLKDGLSSLMASS